MKKLNIVLSLLLAWIGVSNSTAQLSNADQLTAVIGSSAATTMTTGSYYVLQNRSTGAYLVDNSGNFATSELAPASGDADAATIYPYLFTRTSQGYIQSAAGNNLPQLSSDYVIGDETVGDGRQLAPRRKAGSATAGVYTVGTGTATGYVSLQNNSLYLNCDLYGAKTAASYSDWKLTPVNFVERGTSTDCYITYIYKYGDTEWYRESHTVSVGDAYPDLHAQPTGVKYTTIPTGTVKATETFVVECELTGDCPVKVFSPTFATAKWVYIANNTTTYHLRYNANYDYIPVNTSQTTRPTNTSGNYSYQWAFVGNPFTGFKIMNRSAGSGKILVSAAPSSTNEGGDTSAQMMSESSVNTDTYNTTWQLTDRYFGVLLSRPGETTYANNRGGNLSYWTHVDYGSVFTINPVDVASMTAPTLDTSKTYMLVNKLTGKALADKEVSGNHVLYPIEPDATDHYGIWTIEKSGNYYRFKNYGANEAGTARYISTTAPSENSYVALTTTATGGNYYVRNGQDDGYYYLLNSVSNSGTARIALADNNSQYTCFGGAATHASEWELREVTPEETVAVVSSITSGKYYRLVNYKYPDLTMAENTGNVRGASYDSESYAQIWKLTANGGTYSLQNVLSGKYIQQNTTNKTSQVFATGTTANYFTSHTSVKDGTTYFAFENSTYTSYYGALHLEATNNVVGWTYDADASYWKLEEVNLSDEDLAAITAGRNAVSNASNYTNTLRTYFSDDACTTLKSPYNGYTDAELRQAMSSLPSALQEMAVKVKNDQWNENATFNKYEKDFRIHDYEIYSNCDEWYKITKVGPFARLTNPTGIQAKAGDLVYLFVDASVKDSNATIEVEEVTGTNREGGATTLKRGCNAIYVGSDCELFITYLLNNTSKSCNDYPNIKVHIEGGTANGCFDMHRGHTNNDWLWMVNNMFKGKYLHAKGESTLLNLYLSEVKNADNPTGIMKIWDFVFDTEETISGCDQWKKDGRYKMMINNFHDPNAEAAHWGSGHGACFLNINSNVLFSYAALSNIKEEGEVLWVLSHEMGHGHQGPIKTLGTAEGSNNTLAQICNFLTAENDLFQTSRSSRAGGVAEMIGKFNSGYSWIDISGDRGDNDLMLGNRWLYQLWMYFDMQKHYQPETNDGFAFMRALYDAMRNDPIVYGSSTTSPTLAENDYLKMAKYAAQITQTDLSEFFQAWGFWELAPTISNDNDLADQNIWYYYGYNTTWGKYYLKTSQSAVNTVKSAMQAYETKNGNIMFIEDRAVGSTLPTYNNADPSTFGETGYYGTYDDKVTKAYNFTVSGTTVTMTDGQGAVGFKIYDKSGNLVYIANTNTFTVSSDIATALKNGTYTIKVAQGDGTDWAIGECATVSRDVNGDTEENDKDAAAICKIIFKGGTRTAAESLNYDFDAADMDGSGTITLSDLTRYVNEVLEGQ